MLFHCLCDSDWIIIWIAFNWQDFKMFALGSSVSTRSFNFEPFKAIYSFLLNQKVLFWERKSNLDADFITALECITHSTRAQPIQSAFKARWLSDPIIAANWKREEQHAGLRRVGDLSQRCRVRLQNLSLPSSHPAGPKWGGSLRQTGGGVTEVIISSLSGCDAHLSLILSNSSKWDWCRVKKQINTRVPPCGERD